MDNHSEDQTLGELFRTSMGIELRAAEIYSILVIAFPEHLEIVEFWKSLQDDEMEHFHILRSIRDSLPVDSLSDQVNTKIWTIAKDTLAVLGAIDLSLVRTLDHAYNLAHDLEFSEINAIFKFLTLDIIPCEQSDRFIDEVISDHLGKLNNFSKNFGDCEWRKSIPTTGLATGTT